jgi:hypothetical protein
MNRSLKFVRVIPRKSKSKHQNFMLLFSSFYSKYSEAKQRRIEGKKKINRQLHHGYYSAPTADPIASSLTHHETLINEFLRIRVAFRFGELQHPFPVWFGFLKGMPSSYGSLLR